MNDISVFEKIDELDKHYGTIEYTRNLQGSIYILTGKETKGELNFGSEGNNRCLNFLIWLEYSYSQSK